MQPKKTPVIVVKKRRVLVMPENPVVNEKPQEVQKSAVNENKKVQKKDAVAEKTHKKQPQPWYLKKQITFPPKYPKEYFEKCFNKVRAVFPELWTDEKKNLPLKSKRLTRTVLIFTESSDQLSRATDRVPGLPASPGYVQ